MFREGPSRLGLFATTATFIVIIVSIGASQIGKQKVTGLKGGVLGGLQRNPNLTFQVMQPEAAIPGVPARVRREQADAIVTTREQLYAAVAGGKKVIWIDGQAEINMTHTAENPAGLNRAVLHIPDGVTIAGGRTDSNPGPMLFQTRRDDWQRFIFSMGNRTRISGIRFRGPARKTEDEEDETSAIHVSGVADILVDRCEFESWPGAGVRVTNATNDRNSVDRVRVTLNFMHHNMRCGRGYGVVVTGTSGYTRVDRNVFNWNRHHVAATGEAGQGYVADLNFALSGGPKCEGKYLGSYYNQHFDIHGRGENGYGGVAGDFVDIHHNTIRGDQGYYLVKTRPAFWLRGTPREAAHFRDNVVAHDDGGAAVRNENNARNMHIRNNWYDVDTSMELAVGDFDGDGKQDVFQATGGVWVFSPMGQREWRYLNHQPFRLRELRFGDFDGNGKTDVFMSRPDGWKWSRDGVAPFSNLPAHYPVDPASTTLGDFDGDKKSDLFFSDVRGQWKFSSACASAFQDLNSSGLKMHQLRFGDFDGNGKTDVFSLSGNQWSVSYDARSGWQRLNGRLEDDLNKLVFADLNGDRQCDIARQSGSSWQVSWGGKSVWQSLASGRIAYNIRAMLLGDFDGDRRADALTYQMVPRLGTYPPGMPPQFQPALRFVMASAGSGPISFRSLEDMR